MAVLRRIRDAMAENHRAGGVTPKPLVDAWCEAEECLAHADKADDGWFVRAEEYDKIREEIKDLRNAASFDWDTMPEDGRRKFREVVVSTCDNILLPNNQSLTRSGEKQ